MRHRIHLAVVIGSMSALLASVTAQSQQQAIGGNDAADTGQTFEAVSIKPSQAAASGSFLMRPGGSLLMDDGLLHPLIGLAYGPDPLPIVDAPDWMSRQRFTIRTSASGNPPLAEARLMLQKMLADRFQLRVHREQRMATIHALTLSHSDGKLGPHMRPRTPPCEPGTRVPVQDIAPEVRRGLPAGVTSAPCGGTSVVGGTRMAGVGMTVATLARTIENFWLGERVFDRTGLEGTFDMLLENMVDQWGPRGPSVDAAPSDAAPLPAALHEQLGLRIDARREPIDMLVIDRIERPSPD
jgi:uncharacterized protein (TIGR03435 family)